MAKEKLFLGIDDAGRGPVVGPMSIAGALLQEDVQASFKRIGVRDSKLISPERRKQLAEIIKSSASAYKIIKIQPTEIDYSLTHGVNLNHLEALKMAEIINDIVSGTDAKNKSITVQVDCPSTNIKKWKAFLLEHVNAEKDKLNFVVEHKADFNYIAVGAASILAKVTRDAAIEEIKRKYNIECGSGYPSDPLCQKFLKTASKYEKLGIIRKTWQTWKNLKGKKAQKSLGEF